MKSGYRIPGPVPLRPKPTWLDLDNRDDRHEIMRMLDSLHPRKRVAWLEWCCKNAVFSKTKIVPLVSKKTWQLMREVLKEGREHRLSYSIMTDFFTLLIQYNLQRDQALARLQDMTKGKS